MMGKRYWWVWILLLGGPALFALAFGILVPFFSEGRFGGNREAVDFFQKYSEAILAGDDELVLNMRSEDYHQLVKQPDGTVAEVRKSRSEMLDAFKEMRSRWKPIKYNISIISVNEHENGTIVVETCDHCVFTFDGKRQQADTVIVRTFKRENNVLTLWQEQYSAPEDAELTQDVQGD
ncbi:MAG: nuclear transport factor 2 family protein [Planctomycetota bacterium]|jgi:hypothetical protein